VQSSSKNEEPRRSGGLLSLRVMTTTTMAVGSICPARACNGNRTVCLLLLAIAGNDMLTITLIVQL
jgi:hypothetical protein